jgi:hypothetical protein
VHPDQISGVTSVGFFVSFLVARLRAGVASESDDSLLPLPQHAGLSGERCMEVVTSEVSFARLPGDEA